MLQFLTNRPVGVIISFFAVAILGIIAFNRTPTSLLPNSNVPRIVVKIRANNLTVNEIEREVVSEMRIYLSQVPSVDKIESKSSEGEATINILFEHGTNIDVSFVEVNERVDQALNYLPKDIERPTVIKSGVGDIPVWNLDVSVKSDTASSKFGSVSIFARDIIKKRIEQIPGVAMVDVSGYSVPEIEMTPRNSLISSVGINKYDLINLLSANNVQVKSLQIKNGHYQYFVNLSSSVDDLNSVCSLSVNINGRLLRLDDLFTIKYITDRENGSYYNNNDRAVNFTICKNPNSKLDDLRNHFDILLTQLRNDYSDLDFRETQNQTELVTYAIGNLWQDLMIGGSLAFLLMVAFIKNIRSSLTIAVSIPCSLIVSFLCFYAFGLSFNIISLGGLILGLGMIIDNTIVVIDNITSYNERGLSVSRSVIQGTEEVVRPLITSVLTNCSIFIPLIFMNGLVSDVFFDEALSVIIGIVSSLLVSVILLPALYILLNTINLKSFGVLKIKTLIDVAACYESVLKKTFEKPRTVFCIVISVLGLGVAITWHIDKQKLPSFERDDIEVEIDWNEKISFRENKERTLKLVRYLKDYGVECSSWIGEQQYILSSDKNLDFSQSKIYVLTHLNSPDDIKHRLLFLFKRNYPSAVISFFNAKNAFDAIFCDESASIRLNIHLKEGFEMPELTKAESLVKNLRELLPTRQISSIPTTEKILCKFNFQNALLYNVSYSSLLTQVQDVFHPATLGYLKESKYMIPIVLRENKRLGAVDDIMDTFMINNSHNDEIPLKVLLSLTKTLDYKYVYGDFKGRYCPIDIFTKTPREDLISINRMIKDRYPMLSVDYRGSYFDNISLVKDMGVILLVVILLLYLILAAQFESMMQPLFILAEIPLALSGSLIFLYAGNQTLNIMSMIGIIVMCGLTINDSILKIDAINQLRKRNFPIMQAIFEGGHKRIRPIVMITVSSIGALLPTLFMKDLGSQLQKPLALALMGGMLVGMFVSLFFLPLVYWFCYRPSNLRLQKN